MKKTTFLLFAVSVLLIVSSVKGQPALDLVNRMMPNPVPSSPNVASLGKFGDYPVSYFTGIPEISIPIYEVQSGSLKLPITLSYHASGIKPTDVASWVGLGWSLSAGGQISRTVNGKADEEGYFLTALKADPRVCGPAGTGTYDYLRQAALGTTDTEADVFSYSFGGRSGRFLWTYPGVPYLIPVAPISISSPTPFGEFDITDESGILYRFGKNAEGTAFYETTTATNGGNPTFNATTGWPMTGMFAPNSNDQITIDYQTVGTFYTHDISYSYTVMDLCDRNDSGTCPVNSFHSDLHNIDSYGTQEGPDVITFETGKVKFFLGSLRNDAPSLKFLDRIEIQRLDGSVVKTIKFIYSYFTGASGGAVALKLDEVQFLDNAGVTAQKYSLKYFTDSFSWDRTDADLNARDLWGYYNGATTNTDLLVPRTISYNELESSPAVDLTFGGGTDRAVNEGLAKEGVLKKITYPTGGYTEFDFQSNRYLYNSASIACGGLRVATITSSDGSSAPPILKTYRYGDASSSPESGNGLPNFAELEFNYSNTQDIYSGPACGTGVDPWVHYRLRTFHSNSAFSTDPFDASPVRYPFVTEYFGDPGGVNNGKINYIFDQGAPPGDVNHVVPNSGKFFRNSFFWKRGKLTKKTVSDNSGHPLSETIHYYTPFGEASKYVGLGVHQFVPSGGSCTASTCVNESGEIVASNAFFFTTYTLNTGVLLETSGVETTYENGNISKSVTINTTNSYETTNLQPTLTTRSANNQVYKTVNRYPFQLTANASSTGAAKGIYMLNSKHILSTPIETYTYVTKGATENMVSAQVTTYRQHEGNTDYVVPDQIYVWEPSLNVVAKSTYSMATVNSTNNGITMDEDLKPRVKMIRYNTQGDVLAASKSDGAAVSYQYGYDSTLPIAEIKNAQDNRYPAFTQGTAFAAITVGGPSPATSSPITFTVDYQGPVVLKLSVSGTPPFTTYADYSGSLGTGTKTLATGSCDQLMITFSNVSPGAKTIYLTVRTTTAGTSVGACGKVEYPHIVPTINGFTEFFYQGFEEGGFSSSPLVAHTGKSYLNGDYAPSFVIPNTRSYIIEYWYWDGGKWVYISKPYTGPSTSVNEGTAVDDVRIYPNDALMKSYTYDLPRGITSVIDEHGLVTYYDYDSFGRLLNVRNDKGEIEKQYSYHYKGN